MDATRFGFHSKTHKVQGAADKGKQANVDIWKDMAMVVVLEHACEWSAPTHLIECTPSLPNDIAHPLQPVSLERNTSGNTTHITAHAYMNVPSTTNHAFRPPSG